MHISNENSVTKITKLTVIKTQGKHHLLKNKKATTDQVNDPGKIITYYEK